MCGEKRQDRLDYYVPQGSPPRMRGKVRLRSSGDIREWDHPRVCGEKGAAPCQRFIVLGSPPRMRGKAIDIGPIHGELGITPAYAGKSCRPEAAVPDLRDHPRVCGEKFDMLPLEIRQKGSPPRMRGKD